MDVMSLQNDALYASASENRIKNQLDQMTQRTNKPSSDDKLYKACVDFESLMIKQMLDVMRKTVHKTGFTDGGFAEEIFEDMLYEKYASSMAEYGNFGLAKTVYNQLSSYVEE